MKFIEDKLSAVHFDHNLWFTELSFALKEITLFENRLQELLENDTTEGSEGKSPFDALLQDFYLHKGEADQLREQVRNHLLIMEDKIHANGELKALLDGDHDATGNEVADFRKRYAELKQKFHQLSTLQR